MRLLFILGLVFSVLFLYYHFALFFRVLRLQPGHKYCLLGRLSKEVGWNHYDTIKVRFLLFLFHIFLEFVVVL